MSKYDKHLLNSDLDAFKNSGVIQTASLTFSGVLGGGAIMTQNSGIITVPSPDLMTILFDNSFYHSGKFKNLSLELGSTSVEETTTPGVLIAVIDAKVSGNTIQMVGKLFNPYATPVNLSSATINFRFVPYEATFETA